MTAQKTETALPEGVTLPTRGGLYALQKGSGGTELVRLHATQIISNSHAGANFARSMVYAGPHSTVELDGTNAATHLGGAGISFLMRLPDDNPDVMREQVTLVRLKQNERHRVVSTYSQNVFGGQHKRQYDVVALSKGDVGGPDASWVLLTPQQELAPGEHGVVLLPKDPNLFSGEVYDFNVGFDKAKPETTTGAGH